MSHAGELIPRVGMNTFVDYIMAPGPQRLDLVGRQVRQYGQPYVPGSDFYRPMQVALRADLQLRTVRHQMDAAVEKAKPRKAAHFEAVRDGAVAFTQDVVKGGGTVAAASRWDWLHPAVRIRVNPDFEIHWPDGTRDVVKVYYKVPPLERFAAEVAIRLMQMATADMLDGPGTACVLDARRGRLFRQARTRRNLDQYLHGEAAGYGTLWVKLQTAS